MARKWWMTIVFAMGATVLAGCPVNPGPGSDSGTQDSGQVCVPGGTVSCACTDGQFGAQVCNADGTGYDACVCSGSGDGGTCQAVCNPGVCGPNTDGCGGSCNCPAGQSCNAGRCACTPNCSGRNCGSDGCGHLCGSCPSGSMCSTDGVCVAQVCVPSCAAGFDCVSGTCQLGQNSIWAATVDSGSVAQRDCTGATWDPVGGLPDPKFCMNVGTGELCTNFVNDTLSPVWPNGPFPPVYASTYLAGIPIRYLDDDTTSDDTICSGTVMFTEQQFQAGEATISCTCSDGTVNATAHIILTPQ